MGGEEGDHVVGRLAVCILSLVKDDTELSKTQAGFSIQMPRTSRATKQLHIFNKNVSLDLLCCGVFLFGRNTNIDVSAEMFTALGHEPPPPQVLLWNDL